MTEREKYYTLLGLVCEKLPYYAAHLAAEAGLGKAARLQNVKLGRVINLVDLVAMIHHTLTDFQIPEHLLPEGAEMQAAA